MTALIVVDLTPTNVEALKGYSAKAAQTLIPYGGEFLVKGSIEPLHGKTQYQTKVIIQFPDREKALSWYHSSEYQQIIPLRDQGMNSQFHLIG
jgi:uncharacterized protein (DUF1330 family)